MTLPQTIMDTRVVTRAEILPTLEENLGAVTMTAVGTRIMVRTLMMGRLTWNHRASETSAVISLRTWRVSKTSRSGSRRRNSWTYAADMHVD